jgi:hypothetical protein
MSDRVTITHVREAGYCLTGARRHCAALGLDFRRLVRDGLPICEVEGIDDALVQEIVNRARGEN